MISAVTFWRFPEEEDEFVRFLLSFGPIVAVPKGKVRDKSLLTPIPPTDLLQQNPPQILLWLPTLVKDLPIRSYPDEAVESFGVLFTRLPVFTYRRGQFRAPNQLTYSHVTGNWTVLSADESRILDQPDEFIKWGKKVLAWIRKQTPEWHQYKTRRITKSVSEAIRSGLKIIS
ncbi:MAG: hypothetical protein WAK55_30070 [Xanthobacteraceae bacterium]